MASILSRSNASGLLPVLSGCTGWRICLVVLTLAYYLAFCVWPKLFDAVGFDHTFGWFLDSYAILASNDAVAAGLNPWVVNSFDPLGRPHVYSHWWLKLSGLGLTREDNFMLGGMFVVFFFAAAFWWMRVRTKSEMIWSLAVLVSPVVLLAIQRANNDLLVCSLLVPVGFLLAHEKSWVRWLSLVPLLLATALKFYPAAGFIVVLAAPSRKEAWARGVAGAVLLAAVMFNLREDFDLLKNLIPQPRGLMTMGASRAFWYLGFTPNQATLCGLSTGVIALLLWRPWRLFAGWSVKAEDRAAWLGLVLGSVLLVGCFFAGSSYTYRLVLAVLMAPMLWRLAGDNQGVKAVRRLAITTIILLLLMMWLDGIVALIATRTMRFESDEQALAWSYRLAFCNAPVEWAFSICLLGFISRFVVETMKGLFGGASARKALA